MANPAQDVFSEHLGVISALRENYARGEDAAAVASLVRSQQEVAAACSGREERVQEAIKGERRWEGRQAGARRRRRRRHSSRRESTLSCSVGACIHLALHHPVPSTSTELTRRVQRAEAEATYPAEEGAHAAAVAAAADR